MESLVRLGDSFSLEVVSLEDNSMPYLKWIKYKLIKNFLANRLTLKDDSVKEVLLVRSGHSSHRPLKPCTEVLANAMWQVSF